MFGDATLGGAAELAKVCDIIFLSGKPQYLDRVLESLNPHVTERHLIVSIAAGVRIASLEANLPPGSRVVRPLSCGYHIQAMQRARIFLTAPCKREASHRVNSSWGPEWQSEAMSTRRKQISGTLWSECHQCSQPFPRTSLCCSTFEQHVMEWHCLSSRAADLQIASLHSAFES